MKSDTRPTEPDAETQEQLWADLDARLGRDEGLAAIFKAIDDQSRQDAALEKAVRAWNDAHPRWEGLRASLWVMGARDRYLVVMLDVKGRVHLRMDCAITPGLSSSLARWTGT